MSEKARQQILFPPRRKTQADKESSLKHNPEQEFRASAYRIHNPEAPTLLCFPGGGLRKAMATAALDIPGAKKAQIARLLRIVEYDVPVYGAPTVLMSVVRDSSINHTPDIRTRCIVSPWAVKLRVAFAGNLIKPKSVVNLLAAAGMIVGIGDWRMEKGSGDYGCFRVAEQGDAELAEIMRDYTRPMQMEAMATPSFFDEETRDLYTWWDEERNRRGFDIPDDPEEEDLDGALEQFMAARGLDGRAADHAEQEAVLR